MDGILNINKPRGRTSFSIVSMIKRLSGERRVGHAGTLDPAATGVLPVCLGQGTRISRFLMDKTKAYRAEIEMGVATDTYDAEGTVTWKSDPSGISRDRLETELAAFCGLTHQVPPMYSAVKYQGKPLYQWARAGITIERKSRQVYIYDLKLTDWQQPVATMEIVCGKGTYIRSLAHDLGQVLGCGAHLKNLVRTQCGIFDIKDSLSIPQLEDAFRYDYWQHYLYPIDIALSHWAAIVVSDDTSKDIINGRPVLLTDEETNAAENSLKQYDSETGASSGNRCRVYALDGHFLGVLRFNPDKGHWQPEKVFL